MVEKETVVGLEAGLHTRPAAGFMKRAKGFGSDTKAAEDGRGANAKSTGEIMTPGAKKGAGILIRTGGEDAEAAAGALEGLLSAEEA